MDTRIAREPIINAKSSIWGYALAFINGFDKYVESLSETDTADTSESLPPVSLEDITDNKFGLIYVDNKLPDINYEILPCKERLIFVVNLAQSAEESLLKYCKSLKAQGFLVAVEGVGLKNIDSSLIGIADFCIINYQSTAKVVQRLVADRLSSKKIEMIATDVHDQKQFDSAAQWGYSFFHGQFYHGESQPAKEQDIGSSKLLYFQLMKEVFRSEIRYHEMTDILQKDVSLTYKSLKFINSPWYGIKYKIKSVKQALVMLGPQEIRRWMAVAVVQGITSGDSRELLLCSLIRGRAAERLTLLVPALKGRDGELFLLGLLSLIDKLTGKSMKNVLKDLSISEDISGALLSNSGRYSAVYALILSAEDDEKKGFPEACLKLGIEEVAAESLFNASETWAEGVMSL